MKGGINMFSPGSPLATLESCIPHRTPTSAYVTNRLSYALPPIPDSPSYVPLHLSPPYEKVLGQLSHNVIPPCNPQRYDDLHPAMETEAGEAATKVSRKDECIVESGGVARHKKRVCILTSS